MMNWRRLGLCLGMVVVLAGCGGGDGTGETTGDGGSGPVEPAVQEPVGPGAQLVAGLKGVALVGQSYTARVVVVPNDKRNNLTALQISNPTPGGATPGIDANGTVTWVPNEQDYQSTRSLQLTALMGNGPAEVIALPVDPRKERVVLQTTLPTAAGTLADGAGRYLVRVEPEQANLAMSGTLRIVETYNANGAMRFTVIVPSASNARISVLDAPSVLQPVAASANRKTAQQLGRSGMQRPLAATAADAMTADIGRELGGDFLSGDLGLVANVGQVNVYTTRAARFLYLERGSSENKWHGAEAAEVFQIDGNCSSAATCAAIQSTDATPVRRAPVVLVHGFNLGQSVGGGGGTWGALARTLTDRGHPVFELRWNTYMRFEEAAGVLATLTRRVAEITGHQVQVVAHSFGGVVAHTAAMGRGIRYDGTQWNAVAVDGVLQRMLTLGSPLSGIRYVPNGAPLNLTAGRDDDDGTITVCEAITCFQAGSSDNWDTAEISELATKVLALDTARTGLPDDSEGATIRALHQAWQAGSGHAVPFSTIVSLKKRPFDDYAPDLTNATAYDLGDGLISLMGQAVVPQDFASQPFAARAQSDVLGALGADFLSRLDARHAGNMERVERNGHEYFFALRAAHSMGQNVGVSYLIANYPAGGRVNVASEPEADHPLRSFIESTAYLASTQRAVYTGPTEAPTAVVRGRTVANGLALGFLPIAFQLERADTGEVVTDLVLQHSSAVDARFSYDAGRVLADRFPGQLINVAEFKVVLRAGDGVQQSRVLLRQSLGSDVSVGDVDMSLVADGALVDLSGVVIDGQTQSQFVAGAELRLMKGLHQAAALVNQVVDTTTSRRVVADAAGRFTVSGLEPGYYTVVASQAGFITQTQGAVQLSSLQANTVSFSLLRALVGSEAAVTLRWAASGGAAVSRDLDSHLRKSDANNALQYHISYSARTGSATDRLDRDDTDYEGPETITLALDGTARYVYFVHNYTGGTTTLGGSAPTVLVRIGASQREFSLPIAELSTARYWRVFDLVNGVIVPCATGCLGNTVPN